MDQFHLIFGLEKVVLSTGSCRNTVRLERRGLSFGCKKAIGVGLIFLFEIVVFLEERRLGILEV
jgi:hypothetical protein